MSWSPVITEHDDANQYFHRGHRQRKMLGEQSFYYLRHGQTDWNLQHRAQGQQDVELNSTGREQARMSVPKLLNCGIGIICASPLKRALQTAYIIGQGLNIPIVVVDELKEANWGVCEGERKGIWFSKWRSGIATPAGAEPYERFLSRALRGVNTAIAHWAPVLIVAHGGTYWAIEQQTKIMLEEGVENCTPVFHEPPNSLRPYWSVSVL